MGLEDIYSIILYMFLGIHLVLTLFKAAIIVFFISEWTKPSSLFRSAYFVILTFGYCSNFCFSICWIFGHITHYSEEYIILPGLFIIQWHSQFILGLWNAILALNQYTAFVYPFAHTKFWQGRSKIWFCLALLCVFPFIINGYSFRNAYCKLYCFFQPQCYETYRDTQFAMSGVNIIFGILSLFLVITGVSTSHKGIQRTSQIRAERRLVIQTSVSSTLLVLTYIALGLAAIYCSAAWELGLLAYLFYLTQYYPPVFILFVASPAFQRKFTKFYYLDRIFKTYKCPEVCVIKTST